MQKLLLDWKVYLTKDSSSEGGLVISSLFLWDVGIQTWARVGLLVETFHFGVMLPLNS